MSRPQHQLSFERYDASLLRALAEQPPQLALSAEVAATIRKGAEFVLRKAADGSHIYGVNSGFGALCETRVEAEEMELLQYNHVVSHACGVGSPVSELVSRLTMLIKLLTFRTGHTGISVEAVEQLLKFWNHDVIPAIPKRGTVGASGDLSPLAHMASPLLGLGSVYFRGNLVETSVAMRELGWQPLRLKPKEGLALTNGVQYITACGIESVTRLGRLIGAAEVIASLSVQAFSASRTFYQALYQATSWHKERQVVAKNLRRLLEGSNHHQLPTCNRSMQDPYSFRCIPQVHGAIRQVHKFGNETLVNESNGVSDNPLFFPDQEQVLFGGALHGESVAFAMDFMAMGASELASISERRTYQLLSGQRGLPGFLIRRPGINSGLMIPQYTSAALVNECKTLCMPASVDTIMTCQLQEDHVSMGGTSAYKLEQVLNNCEYVLGIELLTAAQAVDLNPALELSPVGREIFQAFRERIPFLEVDAHMSQYLEDARSFVAQHAADWTQRFDLGLA